MTYEEVNEILEYDPTTGLLSWKIDVGPFGRIKAGTAAGSTCRRPTDLRRPGGFFAPWVRMDTGFPVRMAWRSV